MVPASMLEQRNLKLDLLALGLLALTIFLAAALLTYDPADPPSTLVYPQQAETLNVCGHWGAMAAQGMFTTFGLGAYYILVSLAVLDGLLLTRREITQPWIRGVGWILSLVGATTFCAMALAPLAPGPVIGAGGYVGAAGRGLLEMNFAAVGTYILTISTILGGLLLCTDYVLLQILGWVLGKPVAGLGRGVMQVGMAYANNVTVPKSAAAKRNAQAEEEEEVEEETDAEEQELTVRIAGRPADEEEPEEEQENVETEEESEEAVAEEEEEDDEEQEEQAAEPSPRKGLASMLRIRRPRKNDRQEVIEEIEAAQAEVIDVADVDYELPGLDLLLEGEAFAFEEHEKDVRRKAKMLEKTFRDFGFNVRVVEIQTGPVIAQFEIELEAGLRLSKITSLADDLAIALRVPSVRIVAPIPGKNTVGVEVPNASRQLVRLREVMEEANGKAAKMRIPIYLGKDVSGNSMVVDLASLPHLLIAGRTGTGKSVCLNSIIVSMLMTRRPDEVRMLMIDPKMVELSPYKKLPHLMHPVVTDMRKAEAILAWAVEKMEERYQLLARAGVRHISSYNQLGEEELMERMQPESDEERSQIPTHIPYVVIVADEMADLMMTAAKEVEAHIIRLAQKSRAVGIHLVLATQKPTVDVITGLIKSNLPARIAFQVASRTDSRVVLDEMGADKLLGNGDMLFLWPGTSTLLRGQGTYLSDDEISSVIGAVATNEPQFVKELVQLKTDEATGEGGGGKVLSNRDELYEAAVDVVIRESRGSVSLLQRTLGIGYGRAARLIDYMAEDGIVGTYNGSQAREVLLSIEDWEAMQNGAPMPTKQVAPAVLVEPKPRRSNKIQIAPPRRDPLAELEDEEEEANDDVHAETEEAEEEAPFDEVDDEQCEEEDVDEDEAYEEDEDEYDEDEDQGDKEDEEYEEEEYEEDDAEYDETDDEEVEDEQSWKAESA